MIDGYMRNGEFEEAVKSKLKKGTGVPSIAPSPSTSIALTCHPVSYVLSSKDTTGEIGILALEMVLNGENEPLTALADPYLQGLANVDREPSTKPISKPEFEFEWMKLAKYDVRELIYREFFQPKKNYPKNSDKNPLDLSYETPRPDGKKLLARSIALSKDPRDTVSKNRIAKIYRNGKLICVVAGHPHFAEAKKEESLRLKQQ
ncbi:hypothetical protein AgCh_000432 [Apium graveolens]